MNDADWAEDGVNVSIKEQMAFAKEELSQDEKVLAGLIKAERFYRRHRTKIIALSVAVVVGMVGYGLMSYLQTKRLEAANRAYLKLIANPSNSEAMAELKEKNPKLFALVALQRAIDTNQTKTLDALRHNGDPIVADLATYHYADMRQSMKELQAYRLRSNVLLKELAIVQEAYLLMKEQKISQAKERLKGVRDASPLAPLVKLMRHYGVAATKGE